MTRAITQCALLPFLLLAAGKAMGCEAPAVHVHTEIRDSGELWGGVDGEPARRLLGEAQGFRPVLSPDGRWLAVETRLMSNLTVVRLFRRDHNSFVPAGQDLTAAAWKRAGDRERFDPGSADGPQTFVQGWEDCGRRLVLLLRGVWGGRPAPSEVLVTIPLSQEVN
jgi:hypothetical protein